MAEMSRQSTRVLATRPGTAGAGYAAPYHRNLTDEEKEAHLEETKASYEVWLKQRNARLERRRKAREFTRVT